MELTDVKLPVLHPTTWTVNLLDDWMCAERDRCIILCGMWSLWGSRNGRKHGKSPIPLKLAIDWALDVCFHLMNDAEREDQRCRPRMEGKWEKPPPGYVKINTDGGFEVASMPGATDAVIKDENGIFMRAKARKLPSVASALVAEAEARRDGLRLLGQSGHQQVILESDSLELITLWRSREEQRSEITPILREIQTMIAGILSFKTLHTRRTGNMVAHICAKNASSSHDIVWGNNPPSFLLKQLRADCNHND
jgi:ribonuclease HI